MMSILSPHDKLDSFSLDRRWGKGKTFQAQGTLGEYMLVERVGGAQVWEKTLDLHQFLQDLTSIC